MRKKILDQKEEKRVHDQFDVLNVEHLAEVEVSSEDKDHPIEHALLPKHSHGWRAGEPGRQIVRLVFDDPQNVTRIYLHFFDPDIERTQEFVIRWADQRQAQPKEIVRQQWNFSPSGSTHDIEDYRVSLEGVSQIELEITPAIGRSDVYATLQQFYLA
jgi:hypothetical protein